MNEYKRKRCKNNKLLIYLALIVILSISFITSMNRVNNESAEKGEGIDYVIDLEEFNISSTNINAEATTKGINEALEYAKSQKFKTIKLPKGHYSIDTSVISPMVLSDETTEWTHNRKGIVMQSDMTLIMTDAILEMVPTDDPYYSIFTISNCSNSKIIGGTILGDRDTHNYGERINQNGDELESGSYDENTGMPIDDDTKVRTKDFINSFNEESLPNEFILSVLEKTTKNTVDGGVRYIYCYDNEENYLGIAPGGNGFLSKAQLIEGTEKIKVSFKDEKRLDAKYYITKELTYPTHEFGAGITITDSNNIEIENVTIKDTIGDCVTTTAPPLKVTVDNLKFINCTFENARRQGISFVATGENYLVKDCNIGKINGVDPQSGIDIEHYDYVKDVVIDNCNFYENRKWDIINYNGQDIEIKNSKFNGGIGSTYGWNMNIHDNEFKYEDIVDNPKIHQGALFAMNTDKTNEDNAYFKINNNIIKGYTAAGSTSELNLSEFIGNNIYDTDRLTIQAILTNGNVFKNSNISYSIPLVKNEIFNNSMVNIANDKFNTNIEECTFEESQFAPRRETTIRNSKIINKEKPFGDTTAWWNLESKTIFENCDIETQYIDNTAFLANYNSNTIFKNCNMNLSRSLFSLNYGGIEFEESELVFNDYNKTEDIVDFDKIVYGNETNYWKFTKCSFESKLPLRINTKNLFENEVNGNVIME